MVGTNGINKSTTTYTSAASTVKKGIKTADVKKAAVNTEIKSSESKLSDKAKAYLENLRKQYGDYDFVIADEGDDKAALINRSNKEFSVVFSSEELEKMASDENYAADQMHKVDTAVKMSRRINELFGFEQNWGNGEDKGTITEIAITFNEDNTISIFANLEKMNEKSREILEKNAEERAEAKKAEEAKMKSNPYFKPEDIMIKRTRLDASSEEELIDKIMNLDWESVKEVPITIGDKINYSV